MGAPNTEGVGGSTLDALFASVGISPNTTSVSTLMAVDSLDISETDKDLLSLKISLNIAYGSSADVPTTIGAHAPVLPKPEGTSLISWARVLSEVLNALKKQLYTNDATDPLLNRDMWAEGACWAGLQGLFKQILASNASAEISLYNSQTTDILKYNNGDLSAGEYNLNAATNNDTINAFNSFRDGLGITSHIPTQQDATGSHISLSSVISTTIDLEPVTGNHAQEEADLFNLIKSQLNSINNGPLSDYDTTVLESAAHVQALNTAIADYQTNHDATAYNAAVNTYLSYANSTNSTLTSQANAYINAIDGYNQTIGDTNTLITTINVDRLAQGLNPIPYQKAIPIPQVSDLLLSVDVSTIPPATTASASLTPLNILTPVTPIGSGTPTTVDGYLEGFSYATFPDDFANLDFYVKLLTLVENFRNTVLHNLKGKTILAPFGADIIDKLKEIIKTSQTSSGPISGASLDSIIAGLDSTSLERIISDSIITGVRTADVSPLQQQHVASLLAQFGVEALTKISKFAALPALRVLSSHPEALAPGFNAKAAISLGILNGTRSLVLSPAIGQAVVAALKAAGLTDAQIASLKTGLTAVLNLNLLLLSAVQASGSLQLPGLLQQLLGNVKNLPNAAQILASAASFTPLDVLSNPISQALLTQRLTERLGDLEPQLSLPERQNLVQQAVSKALNTPAPPTPPAPPSRTVEPIEPRFTPEPEPSVSTAPEPAPYEPPILGEDQPAFPPEPPEPPVPPQNPFEDIYNRPNAFSPYANNDNFNDNYLETSRFETEDVVSDNFEDAFESVGLSEETSSRLAEETVSFVRSEQVVRDLDNPLVKSDLSSASLSNKLYVNPTLQNALAQTPVDNTSRREFRDNLVAELEKEGVARSDAYDLANQVLLSTQSEDLKDLFISDNVNRDQLERSLLQSDVGLRIAQENAEAQTLLAAALKAFFQQKYNSEVLFRQGLQEQLQRQGFDTLTAVSLAAVASVTQNGVEPLRQSGSALILDLDGLRRKLSVVIANRLKQEADNFLADKIANELTWAIVGPDAHNVKFQEEQENPHSTFNLIADNVTTLVQTKMFERQSDKLNRFFEAYVKPLINVSNAASSLSYFASGLISIFNLGMGGEPSASRPDAEHKRGLDILV